MISGTVRQLAHQVPPLFVVVREGIRIVSNFSIRMRTCFTAPPLLDRLTVRCAMQGDSLTRLRQMRREVQIRRSDLRARFIGGKADNVDSRLSSALELTELAQSENLQNKVPKRTSRKKPPAKPTTTDTARKPVSKGSVYPIRGRLLPRVEGSFPFYRKRPTTVGTPQCEFCSLASLTKDNFERQDGRLPRKESIFTVHNRSSRLHEEYLKTNHANILDGLSDEQRNAVLVHPSMACLVLAGPGSGKTRVLTHRFAYLVEKHQISPYKILAVTFTNKAASEMSERVVKLLLPGKCEVDMHAFKRTLAVGTFHSISARLLRKYGEQIGVPREFGICDYTDSRTVLTKVIKSLERVKTIDPGTVGQALAMISKIKNITAEGEATMKPFRYKKFRELRNAYDEALRRANQLDFDDLLIEARRLLEDCPDVLEELQNRYENVLVDEWQDTSQVQLDIVSLLAGRRRNLFVVGDVDQSIYKFRGADSRNLQTFSEKFPEAIYVTLEQNYRSSKCIVDAAQSVINEDKKRPQKRMTTANEYGNKIVVQQTQDCRREAKFVISQLKHLKISGELERFSDAAVMYRTNAQSRQLEEAFMLANLPYRLHSGVRFYERAEIKDILGYIKLISNPLDDNSFRRIVNTPPRGMGKRTIDAIEQYAEKEDLPLLDAVGRIIKSTHKNGDELSLRPQMVRSLTCFYNLMYSLKRNACSLSVDGAARTMPDSRYSNDQLLNVGDFVATVVEETGYRDFLSIRNHDDPGAVEKKLQLQANVDELIQSASRHKDIREFLETVALMADTDASEQPSKSTPVSLMTLHSGKGLEFRVVFIVGAEDDVIPTVKYGGNHQDVIDEERRLLYVGMTRAKRFLYITWRKSKLMITKNGATKNPVTTNPSRFLQAIPKANFLSGITNR